MDASGQTGKPADPSKLSDKELIEQYCANPKEQHLAAELWDRYHGTVRNALKRIVFRGNLCPEGWNHETFLEASFSHAYINFIARICRFQFRGSLSGWFAKLAGTTALDEWRSVTRRRGERPEVEEPGEPDEPDAEPTFVIEDVDQDFYFRSRYYPLRARAFKNPYEAFATKERKYFVRALLVHHAEKSDEDAHSANTVRLFFWKDWTYTKTAEYFYGKPINEQQANTRLKAVRRVIIKNLRKLRNLLNQEFGIQSFPQI